MESAIQRAICAILAEGRSRADGLMGRMGRMGLTRLMGLVGPVGLMGPISHGISAGACASVQQAGAGHPLPEAAFIYKVVLETPEEPIQ